MSICRVHRIVVDPWGDQNQRSRLGRESLGIPQSAYFFEAPSGIQKNEDNNQHLKNRMGHVHGSQLLDHRRVTIEDLSGHN